MQDELACWRNVAAASTGTSGTFALRQREGLNALVTLSPFAPELEASTKVLRRVEDVVSTGSTWKRVAVALTRAPYPLIGVLLLQAILSLRLIWSNTAFQDEALYLWAGHLEWAHWLHGTSISASALPTYFSGAPVVYPPLGALADSVGGLPAARLLSLCFALAASGCLFASAKRLLGSRAALLAVALFVGTGSVQFLGAFATYDAMALFLLGFSTWLSIRATFSKSWKLVALLVASGGMLAFANATKYASTLFDPVVIVVAVLAMRRERCRAVAAIAGVLVATSALLVIATALRLGGPAYWHGIETTTTARQTGTVPTPGVLFVSTKWIGIVAVLAVLGAAASSRGGRLLGWTLAIAVFLAPVEEARIHTLTSLFKHVGYGAWFGCIVAGYALDAFARAVPPAKAVAAMRVATAAAVVAAVAGLSYSGSHFAGWPNETRYVLALKPVLAAAPNGPVLIDDAQIPEYYLGIYAQFDRITNSSYFAYTDPATHRRITKSSPAYADAIQHRFFSVISLTYGNAPTVYDPGIVSDIRRSGGYRLVSSIPYQTSSDRGKFLTWVREG
jgi:hypothetical protein